MRKKNNFLWLAILILLAIFVVCWIFTRVFLTQEKVQISAENEVVENVEKDVKEDKDKILESEKKEETVVNAYVNEDNHLILVYDNGKEIDNGVIDTLADDSTTRFKVVFQDYDGTILKEQYVSSGENATPPSYPVRYGHIFSGWDGNYTGVSADLTVVAMYEPVSENTVTYTVQFVDYDDVILKIETVLEGAAATAPGNPLRKGYEFIGWDKSFDKVTEDLIVKAQYEVYTGPEIVIEDVKAKSGSENIAVKLWIKNNPGIASLKLAVAFDEHLTLTKVEYNDDLGGENLIPQSLNSPTTLIWVNPFEDETGDWIFATLYFTVADDVEGVFPVTVAYDPNDIYDITEENIKFRVRNGVINVF